MTDTQTVQDMALIRQKVEAIESAMLWTSELLNMMVLDMCKAHVNLSKPASGSHRNVTNS
jgi:hypothetical protein